MAAERAQRSRPTLAHARRKPLCGFNARAPYLASLRCERTERSRFGIDLDCDAAIPGHVHEAANVDVLDSAAIARAETRVVICVAYELDPRSDGHTRTNAGRKEACADGIHDGGIGFDSGPLYPLLGMRGRRGRMLGELAPCRRAAPNSTA